MRPVAHDLDAIAGDAEVFSDACGETIVDHDNAVGVAQQPALEGRHDLHREPAGLPGFDHAEGVEILHPDHQRLLAVRELGAHCAEQ